MADFYITVDKSKHRDALRVPSRTDTASISRDSSHRDSSRSPSTSATSVSSGRPASTDSGLSGVPRQSPKPVRSTNNQELSPLQQLQRQAASLLELDSDDPPLSDTENSVSQDKGFVEGVWSRGRAEREGVREAAKRPRHVRHGPTSYRQSFATAQPARDDSRPRNKRNTGDSMKYCKFLEEIKPVCEPRPPAASQHTYPLLRREDRPECSPLPEVSNRRTSFQMAKDEMGSFNAMARKMSATKNYPSIRSPKAKKHRLPTAAEVYGKPTYFKECPHMSPPAHLPLNAVPRTMKLASGLLRYPTPEHQKALTTMEKNPGMGAPTVEVIEGACATCDLTTRREQETAVLQAWNHKYDKFAQRLVARRITLGREFHCGFAENALRKAGRESPIHGLEDKLLEVNEQREIAVAAIWVGFKTRWGITPAGIIRQKDKEKHEYGRTTPPQFPPRENEEARARARASKTGFMHNGDFGMPMDHVDEPGRVRLEWHVTDVDLPKVPSNFKPWQALEWTKEEYALMELEPWEK